jgi:hypothetical protein
VTARVRTNAVQSFHHQHRDLHQLTYPVPLGRSGLILLSSTKGKGQVFHGHVDHLFFLPLFTHLHVLIRLPIPWIPLGFEFYSRLVLLSPAVMSYHTSLPSFMMLSLTCVLVWELWSAIHRDVSWPCWGSMLWFELGLVWWRWLTPSGDVVGLALICKGLGLRSRQSRTTGAATCSVWNDLFANYEYYR